MADKITPTVTPIKCPCCGKQVGKMTTDHVPHSSQIPQVYCGDCGDGAIAKKLEKK